MINDYWYQNIRQLIILFLLNQLANYGSFINYDWNER